MSSVIREMEPAVQTEETRTIKAAWYAAQSLRPYRATAEILSALTPPGGEWKAVAHDGAITRSIVWCGREVALVNPEGAIDDQTEGQIAMALRASPVLDTALRVILKLAHDQADLALIAKIAETAVAYIEMPAPAIREPDEDEDEFEASTEEGAF